jgi:hypothetical protein
MRMSSLKTIKERSSYAWRFELKLLGSVEDREDALDEVFRGFSKFSMFNEDFFLDLLEI